MNRVEAIFFLTLFQSVLILQNLNESAANLLVEFQSNRRAFVMFIQATVETVDTGACRNAVRYWKGCGMSLHSKRPITGPTG